MNLRWMVRAAKWARNPPSERMVRLVFGVILAALILIGIEYFVGWPEWLTVNDLRGTMR